MAETNLNKVNFREIFDQFGIPREDQPPFGIPIAEPNVAILFPPLPPPFPIPEDDEEPLAILDIHLIQGGGDNVQDDGNMAPPPSPVDDLADQINGHFFE